MLSKVHESPLQAPLGVFALQRGEALHHSARYKDLPPACRGGNQLRHGEAIALVDYPVGRGVDGDAVGVARVHAHPHAEAPPHLALDNVDFRGAPAVPLHLASRPVGLRGESEAREPLLDDLVALMAFSPGALYYELVVVRIVGAPIPLPRGALHRPISKVSFGWDLARFVGAHDGLPAVQKLLRPVEAQEPHLCIGAPADGVHHVVEGHCEGVPFRGALVPAVLVEEAAEEAVVEIVSIAHRVGVLIPKHGAILNVGDH
mmetsp:Transcript_57716/g.182831  ORF Transcript_57716/g.182831 Transcript_57716/m.182831 type:complete len:260 (+) Transcript_57716:1385-2164(+)